MQLTSAAIERAEYHDATRTMLLAFRSGGAYLYHDVPRHVYEALVTSASPGRAFHARVDGRYAVTRYSEEMEAA